ncbi:MAG: carbohydrate kinase family protein [Chloroflexi bacterium]|nr:carbohydrate kinase family protein [Chloroflexota bacterium]
MFVIIGTVTADLLVFSDALLAKLGGDGFRSSNLVFTEAPLTIALGGNGGISAYVLAGLGVPTALCGAVGQDLLGDALVNWLQVRRVNLAGLTRSARHATSTSTILVTDTANQVVFHHLGSSAHARYEEIPDGLLDGAEVLLATSFSILSQWRAGGFAQALARAHRSGGITALDVGPAIGPPVTLAELTPLLPAVDYLIGNSHELQSLTSADDWPGAAAQALAAGARQVVIKQGAEGAAVWTQTEKIHVPAFPVAANISVGAGDSFNVGFLHALGQGRSLEQALRFGNAVAALVVASPRGILDSPSLAQVEAFLDQ